MNITKHGWCYCHICNKDIRLTTQTYFEGDCIKCLSCYTILGYVWDLYGVSKEEFYSNKLFYINRSSKYKEPK